MQKNSKENNIKKLIIISVLAAVLIGGLLGGTVLAAKPGTVTPNVVMESGHDIITWTGTAMGHEVFAAPTPTDVVHVSITILLRDLNYNSASDWVEVFYNFVSKDGTQVLRRYIFSEKNNETMFVEFDTTTYNAGTSEKSWGINISNGDTGTAYIYYNYTMTYPKP